MSDQTGISWTDSTFNPWIGCTKVGPGCDHCYAERDFDIRKGRVKWGAGNPRSRTSAANWKKPVQWNATGDRFMECEKCGWRGIGEDADRLNPYGDGCPLCAGDLRGARRRVFCASLADVFDNEVDPAWRRDLFELIRKTPNLDWLLLTKRIGNAWAMAQEALWANGMHPGMHHSLPDNVWLGATIVNQEEADRDIPKLLAVPARVRFLSMEPMLGPVDLMRLNWPDGSYVNALTRNGNGIAWVIVGGESGPKARPMHPAWVRSLRDQCQAAGVPFHFKQWGEWSPHTPNVGLRRLALPRRTCLWVPGSRYMERVGKKAAGRALDGVEHNGFPT